MVDQPRSRRRLASARRIAVLAGAVLLAGVGSAPVEPALAQPAAADAPLVVEGVEITPSEPGPEALCELRVRIANRGERPASALAFEVKLDGAELPVYRDQLWYQMLEPGQVTEVRLFNFWTSESGRPPPADGELTVEVALREARWLTVSAAEEDGEPVEVWTPAEAVPALPAVASRVLRIGAD